MQFLRASRVVVLLLGAVPAGSAAQDRIAAQPVNAVWSVAAPVYYTATPVRVSAGCRCSRCIPPVGTSVHAAFRTQVANGQAARMVVYGFDFQPAGATLTPRGRLRIAEIACRAAAYPFPILLQPSGSRDLDAERLANVADALSTGPFPVPPERILVAAPLTRGLDGIDAVPIHQGLLQMSIGEAGAIPIPRAVAPATEAPPAQ